VNASELLRDLAGGSPTKIRLSLKRWTGESWQGLPVRDRIRDKAGIWRTPPPTTWLCFCDQGGHENRHDAHVYACLTCGAFRPTEVQP